MWSRAACVEKGRPQIDGGDSTTTSRKGRGQSSFHHIPLNANCQEAGELEKRPITPGEIYNVLKKIPATDLHIMGLNAEYARPDWMILTVLPVPPAAVRPSISVDGGALRSEDDLTYKLAQILKASATVRRLEDEGVPPGVVLEHFDLLQFHVATYMDNDIAGLPQDTQKSGRPIKAIRARLKGKEGRMRGNLMGKRVDFSARTVITGDPNLQLDQVGVPKSVAMTLTYPERGKLISALYRVKADCQSHHTTSSTSRLSSTTVPQPTPVLDTTSRILGSESI